MASRVRIARSRPIIGARISAPLTVGAFMRSRLDPPRFGFEPYHPFVQLGCHMHPRLKDSFGRGGGRRDGPANAGSTSFARGGLGVTMEHMEPKPIALEAHGAATEAEPGDRTMTTQVTFATRSPGPLQDLTLRRPGLAIDVYPLGGLLLLRCVGNASGIESSPELRGSGRKILYEARSGEELTLLLDGGKDEEETIASLAEQNAHVVSPIRWQRGEALITLVLEDGTDPRALLERFPDARLLSKRRPAGRHGARSSLSSPLFLPKLTEKQARALLAAFEAGYYEFSPERHDRGCEPVPWNRAKHVRATSEPGGASCDPCHASARPDALRSSTRRSPRSVFKVQPGTRVVRAAGGPRRPRRRRASRAVRAQGQRGVRSSLPGSHPGARPHRQGRSHGHSPPSRGRTVRAGGPGLSPDDSLGPDAHVRRDREAARPSWSEPRRRHGVRAKPGGHRDPLPPSRPEIWRPRQLFERRWSGNEAQTARAGGRADSRGVRGPIRDGESEKSRQGECTAPLDLSDSSEHRKAREARIQSR